MNDKVTTLSASQEFVRDMVVEADYHKTERQKLIDQEGKVVDKIFYHETEEAGLEDAIERQLELLGMTREEALSFTLNEEGKPAFERGNYERVVQVLTTNTLEDTFYVGEKELTEQTQAAIAEMAEKDPEFLAQALIHARNEGMMQLVPIMGLAILSNAKDKSYFKRVFPRIIQTPDNLADFVKFCKAEGVRKGLGGKASETVKAWLLTLSEYQAVKYSGDTKSKRKEDGTVEHKFSLKDMVALTHPKPETPEQAELLTWIMKGEKALPEIAHHPLIAAFEGLKKAENDEERVKFITEGHLPWEVVIPAVPKMTPELWKGLLFQMPYMALLRNLNNLSKHGVLDDQSCVEYVVRRLTDEQAIRKAKILPFRFFEAYKAQGGKVSSRFERFGCLDDEGNDDQDENVEKRLPNSLIIDALEQALELSFVNLPDLQGELAIATDVSGSMGNRINDKSNTRYSDIAGVYTGALLKKAAGRVHTIPFEEKVINVQLSGQDRILQNAQKIVELGGGGTALGSPIELLLANKQKVDVFIGITDNMDWAYGQDNDSWSMRGGRNLCKSSFLKAWQTYRETVNSDAQAFLIRIDPYKTSVAPQSEPGVHFIYGWSDAVPTYISRIMEGKGNQVDEIKKIEL